MSSMVLAGKHCQTLGMLSALPSKRVRKFLLYAVIGALILLLPAPPPSAQGKSLPPSLVQQGTNNAGGAGVLSVSCSLRSAVNQGDVIIVAVSSPSGVSSVNDTVGGNHYTKVVGITRGANFLSSLEMYSAMSGPGAGDTINVTVAGQGPTAMWVDCMEISGISATPSGSSTGNGTFVSGTAYTTSTSPYSPTPDSVVLAVSYGPGCNAPPVYTPTPSFLGLTVPMALGAGVTCNGSQMIFNDMFTELSLNWGGGTTSATIGVASSAAPTFPLGWGEISAYFHTVLTEQVTITVANSGPAGTATVSGCNPTVPAIPMDGVEHTFKADTSCTISFIVPNDTPTSRYRFSGGKTWNYTTGLTETEAKGQTAYYQFEIVGSYSRNGLLGGLSDPALACTSMGIQGTRTTLSTSKTSPSTIWCDSNQAWSIPIQLNGSSATARSITSGSTAGTISSSFRINPTYQDQTLFTNPDSLTLSGTSNGTSFQTTGSKFFDYGTPVKVAGQLTVDYTLAVPAWVYQLGSYQVVATGSVPTTVPTLQGQTITWKGDCTQKCYFANPTSSGLTLNLVFDNGVPVPAETNQIQNGAVNSFSGSSSWLLILSAAGGQRGTVTTTVTNVMTAMTTTTAVSVSTFVMNPSSFELLAFQAGAAVFAGLFVVSLAVAYRASRRKQTR